MAAGALHIASRTAPAHRSLSARGRHALEGELLHPVGGRRYVDVALGVGRDLVTATHHARDIDRAREREGLAVDHCDGLAIADIEELLLGIRRQREVARKQRVGLDQLLDELAVVAEHLYAPE